MNSSVKFKIFQRFFKLNDGFYPYEVVNHTLFQLVSEWGIFKDFNPSILTIEKRISH